MHSKEQSPVKINARVFWFDGFYRFKLISRKYFLYSLNKINLLIMVQQYVRAAKVESRRGL
jgi:hypothetical protein